MSIKVRRKHYGAWPHWPGSRTQTLENRKLVHTRLNKGGRFMAKVFIGVGHGWKDPGAVSYLVEKDVNLVEGLACRDFLEAHGV